MTSCIRDVVFSVFFVLIAASFACGQTTYYVSSSAGDDANNGTSPGAAWKSVDKTKTWGDVHPYQPGDSILFKRGDVFDGQLRLALLGSAGSPIVIGAYGSGPKPIIRGDLFDRTWEAIPGRTGYYKTFPGTGSLLLWIYAYRNGAWGKMSNLLIPGVNPRVNREQWLDSLKENMWGPGGNTDTIYIHTFNSEPLVTDSLRPVRQANFVGGNYVTIRDLELMYFHQGLYTTDAGSTTSLSNAVIRNLSITSTINIAIYIVNQSSSNNLVDSCRVDSTGWTSLFVYLGSYNKWRYNHVSNAMATIRGMAINGAELCGCGDQGAAVSGFSGQRGNVWEYNTFDNIALCGFDSFWNDGDTIRYNTFNNLGGNGIMLYGKNYVVYGNTLNLNATGIQVDNIGDGEVVVRGNNITTSTYGIRATTNNAGGAITITGDTLNFSSQGIYLDYLTSGVTSTNNIFTGTGRWRAGTDNTHNTLYFTLSSFQSATGYESGSEWLSGVGAPTGTITAAPDSLPPGGGTVTLRWSAALATSASISYSTGNTDTVITVDTSGTRTVNVTANTVFVLTLVGPFGTTTVSAEVIVGGTPTDYSLGQNYPNPFSATTTIKFYLPKDDNVTLRVFDINGREIATLAEGFQTKGSHVIQWTPRRVASGVYRYRLTAGSYSKTRRLVIVR